MKLTTPQIVWHSKEPVFTADFHINGPYWRLATGGADNDIKVWKVLNEQDGIKITFLSSLSRHTKAVNVVRFSPNGKYLASAGDDNVVCLWSLEEAKVGTEGNNLLTDRENKETWNVVKVFRGHLEDIYDLCWSHDSNYIITGSVDNSAITWDVQKGQQVSVLKESKQYVQGVSWDPLGKFVVTLSNDRNLRVYGTESKFKCLHSISKLSLPDQDGESKNWKMWIDEGLNSFFRRLAFTPDGSFLIVPAGVSNQSKNATYIFARNNWSRPVLLLPGPDKPTVVVKCCPVPFELKLKEQSLTSLSYRMVYAVASLDSVLLYDTQHSAPFAYVSNIHYSGITDLAWSNDGLMLMVTSSDCYCSIITFESNELGIPLEEFPCVQENPQTEQIVSTSNEKMINNSDATAVLPSSDLLTSYEAVSPNKPRRIRPTMISSITGAAPTIKPNDCTTVECRDGKTLADPEAPIDQESVTTSNNKTAPRRVNFITLSSFKKFTSLIIDEDMES